MLCWDRRWHFERNKRFWKILCQTSQSCVVRNTTLGLHGCWTFSALQLRTNVWSGVPKRHKKTSARYPTTKMHRSVTLWILLGLGFFLSCILTSSNFRCKGRFLPAQSFSKLAKKCNGGNYSVCLSWYRNDWIEHTWEQLDSKHLQRILFQSKINLAFAPELR